jgi:hypothetical protein
MCREATNFPKRQKIYEGTVRFADATSSGNVTLEARSDQGGGAIQLMSSFYYPWADRIMINIRAGETVSFRAYGKTESANMNDVVITEVNRDKQPNQLAKAEVTVLWVDISRKEAGTISDENEAKIKLVDFSNSLNITRGNFDKLGKQLLVNENPPNPNEQFIIAGFAYEYKGVVKPTDFNDKIIFQRDCEAEQVNVGAGATRLKNYASVVIGGLPANDTTVTTEFRDDKPPLIFDYDMPKTMTRIRYPGSDSHVISKANFRQFVTYDGIRCSDVDIFHVVVDLHIFPRTIPSPGKPFWDCVFTSSLGNGTVTMQSNP